MADQDEPSSIDLRKARELAAAIRDNADYECCDDETRRLARAVLHLTAETERLAKERDAAVELRKKWQANMKDIRQQRDDAERCVAERIAAWLVGEAKMIDAGANPYAPTDDVSVARSDALRSAADDILAMTWRTGGDQ